MGFYSMEQLAKRNSGWRGRERGGHSGETEGMSPSLREKQAGKAERSWGYHKSRKST